MTTATETATASTVTNSMVTKAAFRGSHLALHEAGQGRTLGYLPGMLGTPRGLPFLGELAAATARRVVAPGLPGFSGSPDCADLRGLYDWVVATSEALDLAGASGQALVASSIGAMLALEVAAVRPEAFEQLVLIAPLGLFDVADPVADAFGTTLGHQRSMLTVDFEATAPFFRDDPGRSAAELIEDGIGRYLARTACASLVWPIPEFGLATRLHRVTCPVTLIWGAQDAVNPVSYLARYAAGLPNVVATHTVAGAGHLAEWDKPAEVAQLVALALK